MQIAKQDKYLADVNEDTREGDYYVSVIDGDRYQLLAGPLDTHKAALGMVMQAKELAQQMDARAVFYGFGTCRLEKQAIPRMGILNKQLKVKGGY